MTDTVANGKEPDMRMPVRCQSQFCIHTNRAARLATCVFAALMSMGCLSLNFGNWSRTSDDPAVLTQSGSAKVSVGQVTDIYYPVAYATAPNLELEDHKYEIVEQKADHFRIRNDHGTPDVKWTARGVRAGQPAIIVQPNAATVTAASP
jgi:hypothetical protein